MRSTVQAHVVLAGALLLVGCSAPGEDPSTQGQGATGRGETVATSGAGPRQPPPPADGSGRTTTPVPTPAPEVTVGDGLDDAAELARALYGGGPVTVDEAVADVLTPERLDQLALTDHHVDGATGTWKGTPVAVLTSGDDLTLAVQEDGLWRVVGGRWPSVGLPDLAPAGVRTVLLAGSDARPGQPVDRSRADALQLLSTDGQGGGGVVGIARDSWVEVPGHGHSKINAALALGGPELLARTVSGATGVDVDGYLVIGFDGFKSLVQDVGGLPIVLDHPHRAMWAELPGGEQLLTGAQALAFARERLSLPDGDFGRSGHQGELVLAALALVQDRGPAELPHLLTVLSEHAQTDLDAAEALTLLARGVTVDQEQVGHAVAKGPTGRSDDGQSIVRWGPEARSLFDDLEDGRLDQVG